MKKKISIKTKAKRMNEIRFHSHYVKTLNKKMRHPTYVWQKRGNLFDYHTITHSKVVNDVEFIELKRNPNPSDDKTAYLNPKSESDLKSAFGRKKKNWRLHPDDIKKIHEK